MRTARQIIEYTQQLVRVGWPEGGGLRTGSDLVMNEYHNSRVACQCITCSCYFAASGSDRLELHRALYAIRQVIGRPYGPYVIARFDDRSTLNQVVRMLDAASRTVEAV